jgi:hypothetical protein
MMTTRPTKVLTEPKLQNAGFEFLADFFVKFLKPVVGFRPYRGLSFHEHSFDSNY